MLLVVMTLHTDGHLLEDESLPVSVHGSVLESNLEKQIIQQQQQQQYGSYYYIRRRNNKYLDYHMYLSVLYC